MVTGMLMGYQGMQMTFYFVTLEKKVPVSKYSSGQRANTASLCAWGAILPRETTTDPLGWSRQIVLRTGP